MGGRANYIPIFFLGLLYSTCKITAAITEDYFHEFKELLDITWHPGWKCFLFSKLEVLLEKYARCVEAEKCSTGFIM